MKVAYGRRRIDFKVLEADPDFKRLAEPIIALGAGLPEKGVAFAFQNWSEFVKFTKGTQAAEKIANIDERRRKLRKRNAEDTIGIAERLKRKADRIDSELHDLAKRTGLAWGSKQLFLRATTKADPLEGSIFDPSILFAGFGFTGNALTVAYPGLPDLNWFPGMNNNVSSVQIVGVVGLFSNTWFRGASRVLFGLPFFQIADLRTIFFDNVTSSVLVD
jgi:hypothetical protein